MQVKFRLIIRLQKSLVFLSSFCRSVSEISMRDAGIEPQNSLSSPTRNFHARSRSYVVRFQPERRTLKYGLFCSLTYNRLIMTVTNWCRTVFDWKIKFWISVCFTQNPRPLYSFEDNGDYVYDVQWSPIHPALFAAVDGTGRLDLWNLNNDTEVQMS